MVGGIQPFTGNGHMEADDIGTKSGLVIDKARIRIIPRLGWIAAQYPHAERLGLASHALAGIARANHRQRHGREVEFIALRQHQQGGEHIIPHRILVATGGAEEGNIAACQQRLVHMVGAYGGGADKPEFGAGRQQIAVDAGDRTHQQHIGIQQIAGLHLPSGQGDHLAKFGKQLHGMGHILINDYLHRALFGHNRHGGAILAQSRPRFQPVMQSGAKRDHIARQPLHPPAQTEDVATNV